MSRSDRASEAGSDIESTCARGSPPGSLGAVMRLKIKGTVAVAAALPMRVASWIARAVGAAQTAGRLCRLTTGVPLAAYLATGVIWAFLLPNGVLYPVFDSANLNHSWGGPTLAGAWAVHFALGVGVLLVVALPFALWRPPQATSGR